MYKIGNTSGLEEINVDDGKENIKIIGDVVDKMVKKCEDVPKKMTAPNKIMEITDGCFSSAQVVEVKDEKGGAASSSESEDAAAEEASEDAAKTSGSCGGGRSSQENNKDAQQAQCNKSCCGGSSTQSTNQCTGDKLVDTEVPSSVSDILAAGIGTVVSTAQSAQTAFMNSYCAYQPFPECRTCPYGRQFYNASNRDLNSLFSQIQDAMAALTSGFYELASGMFICPGLVRSVLTADLGPIAAVAGANAVASICSLTAARGALDVFADLATAAVYTDFRRDIMRNVDRLFKSGSRVGIPRAFVKQVNSILTAIGCSSNSFTRMTTRSGSSRSSRFGCGSNLWGSKSSGTKKVTTKSQSPANNSKTSRVTGKKVNYGDDTQKWEETSVDDAIPTVYKSSERQEPTTESVEKATKAREKVEKTLTAAKEVSENPEKAKADGKTQPTSQKKTYNTTTDTVAQKDKTYYKKDSDGNPVKVEVEAEQPLETIEAKYGPLYEVEDNGVTEPDPTPITVDETTTAVEGKTYTYKDPATEKQVEISVQPGEKIKTKVDEVAKKLKVKSEDLEIGEREVKNPTHRTYKTTTDQKIQEDKTYYRKDPTTKKYVKVEDLTPGTTITEELFTLEEESGVSYQETTAEEPETGVVYYVIDDQGTFVTIDVSEGFPEETTVYEKLEILEGSVTYATEYTGAGPCVMDNGLMIEEPVFIDMASQSMGVDTTTLVTDTRIPAGEMVQMEGLGLTLYEIKMAYLLDHERNGSILPVDVNAEVVSTILDTIADND